LVLVDMATHSHPSRSISFLFHASSKQFV
jgi:hypothetical protein